MFTYGSLFSGIGGLDLGFDRQGFIPKYQVENNTWCQRVLAKHWPTVPKFDDITKFVTNDINNINNLCVNDTNKLYTDVIIGGFPCQDVSHAQRWRERGLHQARSGLFYEFCRVAATLRPRLLVMENVLGVTEFANTIYNSLRAIGYSVISPYPDQPFIEVSASVVGAPHRRRRVFIYAYPGPLPCHTLSSHFTTVVDQIINTNQTKETTTSPRHYWLSTLSGVERVAYGLSPWMDEHKRVAALGNAVVPQVAEKVAQIAKQILGT